VVRRGCRSSGILICRPIVPTLGDAARQTLVVFFRARFVLQLNLWTMSNEFFGSLLVFGLIYVVMRLVPKSGRTITVIHFLGILLSAEFHHNFVPFLVGSYLAYLNSVGVSKIRMSSSGALMVSVVALACFSTDNWVVLTVGSLLVMAVLMGS
jgi:peptidoglycan/LPS O-acetylase OafA/YrhL